MKGKNNVLREILVIVIASVLMAMVMSVGSATELSAPEFGLEGNIWTLTAFIEGDAVQSPILNTTITAYFEAGKINGSAGCNNYIGSYMVDVNEITIGELGVTMMYCGQEGVMQQEAQYLEMLGNVATYAIEGNQLTLSTDDGSDLVYNATELPAPEFSLEGNTWMLTSFIAAQITAGADDGFAARTPEYFSADSKALTIGTDLKFAAFLRFSDLKIPANATITKAYITVVPAVTNPTGPMMHISAGDVANPSAPTTSSDFYARKRTSSSVNWDASSWAAGESVNSTDISSVIQELVDSYDYFAGAPILLFLDIGEEGIGNQYFATFENAEYDAPKLYVEYSTGESTDTKTPIISNIAVNPPYAEPGTPINISATVVDDLSGVRDVKCIVSKDGEEVSTVFMLDRDNDGIYSGTWHTMLFLGAGIYNINVIATDTGGNEALAKPCKVEIATVATGSISIRSTPSGATIKLETPDGPFIGPTVTAPHTFTTVPVGMSTITLSLDGYLDWSTSVYVIAGETSYVHVTLDWLPAQAPPQTATLTPGKSAPQSAGATIKWSASATDLNGDTLYYQFWIRRSCKW
ncbi:MAG: META domain-containing protein [Methanophagales archaeon]|nr:META domain-containing protein [Methanophagales archaeon]